MNKIEDAGELPGLMIEEMMESASMVQGEEGEVREAEEKVIIRVLFVSILRVMSLLLSKVFSAPWLRMGRGWWR